VVLFRYFRSRLCRRADAAAVFEFLPVLPLFKTFDAALPALFDVFAIDLNTLTSVDFHLMWPD
jgi:hypothetical protein